MYEWTLVVHKLCTEVDGPSNSTRLSLFIDVISIVKFSSTLKDNIYF